MKVGSLVVCVDSSYAPNCIQLVKGKIYTIREIKKDSISGRPYLTLDELVNIRHPNSGNEIGYRIGRFRELDTPTEISIEEFLTQEV